MYNLYDGWRYLRHQYCGCKSEPPNYISWTLNWVGSYQITRPNGDLVQGRVTSAWRWGNQSLPPQFSCVQWADSWNLEQTEEVLVAWQGAKWHLSRFRDCWHVPLAIILTCEEMRVLLLRQASVTVIRWLASSYTAKLVTVYWWFTCVNIFIKVVSRARYFFFCLIWKMWVCMRLI